MPDEVSTRSSSFLTSVFTLLVGIERLFHLDDMEDVGFALLCGDRWPSRFTVGGWRRHLSWQAVDAFCRRTSPWHLLHDATTLVSYDEHTIPRWTRKYRIAKGYVTTRNKRMRCEKLFYGYDLVNGRYLTVRATPGDWGLIDLAVPLTRQTLERGQPTYLHALFDAGAGQSDAGVRALWDLADAYHPRLDVTLRACRYPHRVAQWKALPAEEFAVYEEPGPYVDARPKEVRVAETTTVLKDEDAEQAVRTIVCRERVPGPKKDRWHPLYTTAMLSPYEEVALFRTRQNHEQSYRLGVYDEFLDAVPCGYDKESPDPRRPRFQRGPLQMIGWLVALVYNGVADLAEQLVGNFQGSHVRTLRRMFFNRPGTLYETPEALIVHVDRFGGREPLIPLVDAFNAAGHRLPWLEDRRVVVSLAPAGRVGNDCRGSLLTGGP